MPATVHTASETHEKNTDVKVFEGREARCICHSQCSGFGFEPLEDDERQSLSKINHMVFPGSVWLKKPLYQNTMHQENGQNETSTTEANDPGEMGTLEEGFSTTQSVQESNTETGTLFRDLENSQSHKKQDHVHVISSDEQEHRRSSNHEFSVQEAHTEQYPDVLSLIIRNHMKSKIPSFHVTNKSLDYYPIMNFLFKKPILRQEPDMLSLSLCNHMKNMTNLMNNSLDYNPIMICLFKTNTHTETGSGHARSENLQSDEKHDLGIFL